MVIAVMKY